MFKCLFEDVLSINFDTNFIMCFSFVNVLCNFGYRSIKMIVMKFIVNIRLGKSWLYSVPPFK